MLSRQRFDTNLTKVSTEFRLEIFKLDNELNEFVNLTFVKF